LIIADTGFWLALGNRRDRHHEPAKRALERVREPLVTTWPVMTETCHLLAARLGVDAELRFVERAQAGAFEIFNLEPRYFARIHTLMEKYRGLPMDLADASLVLLAEELSSGRILSTDIRDFKTYRWKSRKPFRNLLADAL
jgi:predicted nucleic acid-binding protein